MLIWFHPASASEIFFDLKECISQVVGEDAPLADYFTMQKNISRFALRGTGAQAILSQVFWPHIVDKNSASTEHHSFFLKVLRSEGMDAVWKHGAVVNITAVDVRHLSIKGTKCESSFVADSSRPWEAVSKLEWERITVSFDSQRRGIVLFFNDTP